MEIDMNKKPLNKKNYGSIGHLPCSRMGSGDHKITEGQSRIATEKPRDKHDLIIVQEKLDGSNVGVALVDSKIFALTRAGYEAHTSPYEMHHQYDEWVKENESRFRSVLKEGQRICGEWLTHAHGTIYDLPHEPFVAFDLIDEKNKRYTYDNFIDLVGESFVVPKLINKGEPISVEYAMEFLGDFGFHGAQEKIEGAVWRVERKGIVDYLCKYVRPDKVDGKYLDGDQILNTWVNP